MLLHELKSVESDARPLSADPISPRQADKTNEAFFAASKRQESAPMISIYEGDHKVVKLRATAENSDIIQPSAIDLSGKSLLQSENKNTGNERQRLRPGLEPYTQPLLPKESASPQKKLSKSERRKQKKEIEEINQSIESELKGDSYKKYEDRMLSTTKDAVLKSQQLLEETKKLRRKHPKKKQKDSYNIILTEESDISLPSIHQPPASSSSRPYQTVVVSGSKTVPGQSRSSLPNLETNSQSNEIENDSHDISHSKEVSVSQKRESKYVPSDLGEDEREGYLNQFDWENLLARHILSVYATSHSQNSVETRAVTELLEVPLSPPSSAGNKRQTSKKSSEQLKQTGLFNNLQKERKVVEKQSVRPSVTSRSTIMILGKTATATSMTDLNSTRNSTSPPGSRPLTAVDPIEDVASKSLEKLKISKKKQRHEIKTTSQTNGVGSVIRAPAKCFPIWFYSSGDVYAEWVLLPNGVHLQSALDSLMEKKNYLKYTEIVSQILDDCWIERTVTTQQQQQKTMNESTTSATATASSSSSRRKKFDINEVIIDNQLNNNSITIKDLQLLYRQYILVSNAFATICLENKEYSTAMILIRNAEELLKREDIFNNSIERLELKGYLHITFAFYFHKKKMTSAALSHSQQALDINRKLQKDDYVAMCLLMISCCKYQVSNFKEAHRVSLPLSPPPHPCFSSLTLSSSLNYLN